jgi:hypothetical protein
VYSMIQSRRSGSVSTSSNHWAKCLISVNSVSTLPASLQKRMWEQVAFTIEQLGQ